MVCTAHGPEYEGLANITFPSVRHFIDKHRYYFVYDPHRADKDACKIALYQMAYATKVFGPEDVFFWIDTDALIMDSTRSIEQIVYEHMPPSVHYLIGTDVNGINSGTFLARFSPEANLFLTVANNVSVGSGWADQVGLAQVSLMEPHRAIYKEVRGSVFNCNLYGEKGWNLGEYGRYVNDYVDGQSFVLHLAGIPEPRRSELLKAYAQKAR